MNTTAQMPSNSQEASVLRVSSVLYFALWIAGLPVSFYSFYQLQVAKHLGLSESLAIALAVASAILLALIYYDLDRIEKLKNRDEDYPNWLNRKSEILLRLAILACLLFAAGEFHAIQNMVGWMLDHLQLNPHTFLGSIAGACRHSDVFVTGTFGAFAFLTSWNCGAFYYRCRSFGELAPSKREEPEQWAHFLLVFVRILVFLILVAISSFYWFVVWFFAGSKGDVASILVVIYLVCVTAVALLRVSKSRRLLEAAVAKLVVIRK